MFPYPLLPELVVDPGSPVVGLRTTEIVEVASAGNLTSSQDQSLTLSCGIPEYFTTSLKKE